MTENNNGYVLHIGSSIVGPFISHADAYRAMTKLDTDSAFVKPLKPAVGSVKVLDCDRPECRHCRDMERESLHALSK